MDPSNFVPPGRDAIDLPVDALAIAVLQFLVSAEDSKRVDGQQWLNGTNLTVISMWPAEVLGDHPTAYLEAVAEAWAWLVAKALVALNPGGTLWFVTRHGRTA